MTTKNALFIILLSLIVFSVNSFAQDSSSVTKKSVVKSIWEIPHNTVWQKWMWIHRSVAFGITKERSVNYDTAFIKSNYKRLVVTLPLSTRFLKFSLVDLNNGNKLTFSPNLQYNLGVSISSRWASFIVNTGVKVFNRDTEIKGKTKYQDYQLNLYGRKITTDMFFQFYSGFYIKNSKEFPNYVSDKPYEIRKDVYSIHIGVSSYYILNNRRFSYGNSFAFVEQQKKSAGSALIGSYYSYFEANADPSLVSFSFRSSFDSLSIIRNARTQNFGINIGYIYTLVFLKKCYATASLVQGLGAEQMNYQRDDYSKQHKLKGGVGKLHVRLATGYDNDRYFIGAMVMSDYFLFTKRENSILDYSYGKFMIYIGYRFSVLKAERKILRKLKLTDY
jgi:hypothetical protein